MNEFRFVHVWGVGIKSVNRGWRLWNNRVYATRSEAEDAMREFKAQVRLKPGMVRVFKYVPQNATAQGQAVASILQQVVGNSGG